MPRVTDRPSYGVRWTVEDLARVAADFKAGHTIPDIAKAMGRSQEAVRSKLWKAGLLPSRKRDEVANGEGG